MSVKHFGYIKWIWGNACVVAGTSSRWLITIQTTIVVVILADRPPNQSKSNVLYLPFLLSFFSPPFGLTESSKFKIASVGALFIRIKYLYIWYKSIYYTKRFPSVLCGPNAVACAWPRVHCIHNRRTTYKRTHLFSISFLTRCALHSAPLQRRQIDEIGKKEKKSQMLIFTHIRIEPVLRSSSVPSVPTHTILKSPKRIRRSYCLVILHLHYLFVLVESVRATRKPDSFPLKSEAQRLGLPAP